MSSRKFAGIFIAIFLLGAFPLLMVQLSGAASAGLSTGFAAPVSHIAFMLLFILIGMWATVLGGVAAASLPFGVTVMLFMGGALELDISSIPYAKQALMTGVLLYAISASVVRSRLYLLSIIVFGSIAFALGQYYVSGVSEDANALYFLFGVMISNVLIMAIGLTIGITVVDDMQGWIARLREKNVSNAFFSLFF